MRNDAMCCESCYAETTEQFEAFGEVTYCQHRMADYVDQKFDVMRSYIGQRCKVILDRFDPQAVKVGLLESLADDGEAVMVDDDGVRYWCWPVLEIQSVVE